MRGWDLYGAYLKSFCVPLRQKEQLQKSVLAGFNETKESEYMDISYNLINTLAESVYTRL